MRNANIIGVANQPMDVSFVTPWVDIAELAGVLIHIAGTGTGTPSGTFFVEASNDPLIATERAKGTPPPSAAAYVNISGVVRDALFAEWGDVGKVVAGVFANVAILLIAPRWVRVRYTRTSGGTGAVANVWVSGTGA